MQNRSIYKKVRDYVDAQGLTIQQIQDITASQIKSLLHLTGEEFREYGNYARGIKLNLIRKIKMIHRKQQINEMANKFLLSATAISQEEAFSAAEKVFEDRDMKTELK